MQTQPEATLSTAAVAGTQPLPGPARTIARAEPPYDARSLVGEILSGRDLDEARSRALLRALADPEVDLTLKGAALAGLRMKGETPTEVRGLAGELRAMAVPFPVAPGGGPVVDTCGTGGDGSGSFNLSTATALCAAGAADGRFRVVKHGNRSVTSSSGSADVLEALRVPLPGSPDEARAQLAGTGFTFLFAPQYHGATRAVVPVRRALGTRTVFNILGPLSNPAAPTHQLVGAYDPGVARTMASALAGVPGLQRAFVVHGEPGWDEATPVGSFLLLDVCDGRVEERIVDPRAAAGLPRCRPEDLAGGDPEHNARNLEAVLAGRDHGPHADAVALNAGLVFLLTGCVEDLRTGVEAARSVLAEGRGARLIERLRQGVSDDA